jgi:transposase-like protein
MFQDFSNNLLKNFNVYKKECTAEFFNFKKISTQIKKIIFARAYRLS